jgi:NAD(P)-dependent dehydrogenase (short-subunit alcohol dehydrogenase family)
MARRRPPVESLARRRCFITGAASGIGRATALAAASRGAELHLTDRDAGGLAETAALVERGGGRVLSAEALDITDHEGVLALAAAIHAEHGSVDVVMNVAGVSTWGTIERLTHADWEQMIDVDLRGPISVLEAFVPAMIEAGRGGHVVNVSSAAGLLGLPWHAAYSAAKFGLRGVSEVLRFDLRRHRIGVSLVCPGGVATPLVETATIRGIDPEAPAVRKLRERFARHAVSPEVVAEKIVAGIERDRYLVFTSADIRLAFLAQRWCPPAYELAMRRLGDRLAAVAARSAVAPTATGPTAAGTAAAERQL